MTRNCRTIICTGFFLVDSSLKMAQRLANQKSIMKEFRLYWPALTHNRPFTIFCNRHNPAALDLSLTDTIRFHSDGLDELSHNRNFQKNHSFLNTFRGKSVFSFSRDKSCWVPPISQEFIPQYDGTDDNKVWTDERAFCIIIIGDSPKRRWGSLVKDSELSIGIKLEGFDLKASCTM